jgi:hypothetical protein
MSRINSDAILNMLWNRLSGLALPTVPCILGPFKVHHVLCDWGASMNILPKILYDYLDEDPLVPTPYQLWLPDSVILQPYRIAKDVLIVFQDSSTLVDFMVVDKRDSNLQEKSGKLSKIPSHLNLHKTEFSWDHLYARIWVTIQIKEFDFELQTLQYFMHNPNLQGFHSSFQNT